MEQKRYSETVAEELIAAIEAGTAPWQKPWAPGEALATAPINPFTGNQYRGTNSIYLRNAGYDDPRWMTYNQAQKLGGQVRKGEVGRTVQHIEHTEKRDVLDDNGNPVLDENGKKQQETVILDEPKVFSARVFNAEQIDGLPPLPSLEERIAELTWNFNDRIEAILEASGADIRHQAGDRAFYNPTQDYIVLPERNQFQDDAGYYATALHELGHWTGHESRLDRDLKHPFGSIGYAKEELRAEISSFMNAQTYGVSHDPERHASYIASWVKILDDKPQEIISASIDAAAICKYIRQFDQTLKQEQSQDLTQTPTQTQSAQNTQERIYLDVPYQQKGQAKALGAKWDGKQKSWYAPAGVDMEKLSQWLPKAQQNLEQPFIRKIEMNFAEALPGSYETGQTFKDLNELQAWYQKNYPEKDLPDMGYIKTSVIIEIALPDGKTHQSGVRIDVSETNFNPHTQNLTTALAPFLERWGITPEPELTPNISQENTYLEVPYREKNYAKSIGAKWDQEAKSWYAPAGTDLNAFEKWLPKHNEQQATQTIEQPAPEMAIPQQETTKYIERPAQEKTYLAVPYEDKDDARALGARWDNEAKCWYAPEGADMTQLNQWLPKDNLTIAHNNQNPIDEFAIALKQAGLVVNNIQADGQLHRVPIEGKPTGRDGAYVLHLDGHPAGFIQNFVTGHKEQWKSGAAQRLSPEELAQQRASIAAKNAQREQQRLQEQKEKAQKATQEYQNLPKATPDHPYLAKKGLNQDIIDKLDLRVDKLGNLVVPVKNKDGEIQSLQRIGGNGFKQFEAGCKAQGGFTVIGESALKAQDNNEPIIISTGVATAASIHMATGEPVVVAFQDSNLKAVAEEFKAMYPYRSVFIAGDNDEHNVAKGLKNSGLESAKLAAKSVNGKYIVPKFSVSQRGREYSDFSDLHRIAGLQSVKRQVQAGLMMARANVNEDKERIASQKQSEERVQEQKEVRQHKREEQEKREKKRGRTI